jgi:hypothetical protein
MAGFAEPKTNDEAERLKKFLESGAAVSIEELKAFGARGGIEASLDKPGTLVFETSADELVKLNDEGSDRRTLFEFDLAGIDRQHEYVVAVFLNNEHATDLDAKTPGFAGTIGFFCEVEGPEGVVICPIDQRNPLHYQLDVTDTLKTTGETSDLLRATLLLVPDPERKPEVGALQVDKAAVRVVQSVVKAG